MSTTLHDEFDVIAPTEEEKALARDSSRQLASEIKAGRGFRLQVENGKLGRPMAIPPAAAKLLLDILTEMSKGNAITLIPVHAELTTVQAAEVLNVSRPHLIKLLDRGDIPHHKVGTHRRVRFLDLMAYKKKQDEARRQALTELTALDQEYGIEE
jgi:excisionase family DNA binding protein